MRHRPTLRVRSLARTVMLGLWLLALLTSPVSEAIAPSAADSVSVKGDAAVDAIAESISDGRPLSSDLRSCVEPPVGDDPRLYQQCLDLYVLRLRTRLASTMPPDTVLPSPSLSVGAHTACLKFGRGCPVEYAVFLERLLEVHSPQTDQEPTRPTTPVAQETLLPAGASQIDTARDDDEHDGISVPFAFNASWTYEEWTRMVNLYTHASVLLRTLADHTGPALRPSDVLTPARVREWQQALLQNQSQHGSPPSTASTPPCLWRCWWHYTLPARVAGSATWTWLWVVDKVQAMTAAYADASASESTFSSPGGDRLGHWLRRCVARAAWLVWPRCSWLWWLSFVTLVGQLWGFVDALAGEPLDDELVQRVLNSAPTGGGTHGETTEPSGAPESDDAQAVATSPFADLPEPSMEQLARYYSVVDLHRHQHLPLVMFKVRRTLCVCLLSQMALLVSDFVGLWQSTSKGLLFSSTLASLVVAGSLASVLLLSLKGLIGSYGDLVKLRCQTQRDMAAVLSPHTTQ